MAIQSQFGARSTAQDVVQGHDLSGKTALITGASSGLGVETARALLIGGAEVILAVRDVSKGAEVAAELHVSTGNPRVHVLPLDVTSFTSIRQAAQVFTGRWQHLDILINNAGVMATPFRRTSEGFELQFGTNHVGHFLLTTLLVPALQAAAPARVVVVSSSGHRRSDIQWDDIHYQRRPYDPWEAYGQSKTATILFAVGFQQRYAASGVTANALHPGGIATGLQKYIPPADRQAFGLVDAEGKHNPSLKTPEQGAATTLWAAVGSELDGVGGLYLEDCQEASVWSGIAPFSGYMPYARSPASAERLWQLSESFISMPLAMPIDDHT